MVKFGYTIIYVSNVNDALSFFEKAFKMNRKFITEERDYESWTRVKQRLLSPRMN